MKVKDIMIPFKDHLTPDNTLRDAVNLLKCATRGVCEMLGQSIKGVMALPVLDRGGKLVGILSMTDILKAVYPSYMSMMNLGDFTWDGMVESLAKRAGDRKVKEVMTEKVITVRENDALMECVDHMIKNHIRRMPVLDGSGNVVGMVYMRDVFFVITKAMLDDK